MCSNCFTTGFAAEINAGAPPPSADSWASPRLQSPIALLQLNIALDIGDLERTAITLMSARKSDPYRLRRRRIRMQACNSSASLNKKDVAQSENLGLHMRSARVPWGLSRATPRAGVSRFGVAGSCSPLRFLEHWMITRLNRDSTKKSLGGLDYQAPATPSHLCGWRGWKVRRSRNSGFQWQSARRPDYSTW